MSARPEIDPNVFFSPAYAADPYPTLKLLRDHYPAYRLPHGVWMITRYDDVVRGFKDTENFSASPNGLSIGAVFGPTLMEYDGDEHTKLRNLVGYRPRVLLPEIIDRTIAYWRQREDIEWDKTRSAVAAGASLAYEPSVSRADVGVTV